MQKIGKTVVFDKPPIIVGHAGVAGKKEGEGPLAKDFDMILKIRLWASSHMNLQNRQCFTMQ